MFTINETHMTSKLGVCEFDDVFHNTLGTMLGCMYLSFLVVRMKADKV